MKIIGAGFQTLHDRNFSMKRPNGYGAFLLLFMKTESFHVLGHNKILLSPDTLILYDATTEQNYGAVTENYIDDWIHFSTTEEESSMFESLGIPLNTPIKLKDTALVSELIRTVTYEFYSVNANRESTSIFYLQVLFNKINETIHWNQTEAAYTVYGRLVSLRTDIYNRPADHWTIATMARELNLSSSYFQHTYKKYFGSTVISDVIAGRIELGKKLLTGTDLSVGDIAEQCGYEYDVYFMRQFKSRTGLTPCQYRQRALAVLKI